jgi:hypothetical protein
VSSDITWVTVVCIGLGVSEDGRIFSQDSTTFCPINGTKSSTKLPENLLPDWNWVNAGYGISFMCIGLFFMELNKYIIKKNPPQGEG